MLASARKAGERPLWIGEGIWAELCQRWSTPEYTELRLKAQQNRASDCGGIGVSLHTGGSIPHTEHKRRLKQLLGREPTMAELHARTHKRQKTQQWVDIKSQQIHEAYQRFMAEERQSLPGESSSSQPDASADFATWEKVAGGRKKGRQIYGIGSVAQVSPSSYSSCSVDSVIGPSDAALHKKVDLLLSALGDQQKNMQILQSQFEDRLAIIEEQLAQSKGKTVVNEPVIIAPEEDRTDSE